MRIYPGTTVDYEFAELGTLGYSGTLNDRQFAALRAEGLTGSLPDMFGQFDGSLEPVVTYEPLTFTWYNNASGNLTSLTYTNMAIGSPHPDRWVIVGVYTNFNAGRSLSAVTIGGVSATLMYASHTLTAPGARLEFWKANVPTGTVVSVVAASADTMYDGTCGAWVCYKEPIFSAGVIDHTVSGTSFSLNIDVPEGGAVIAFSTKGGSGYTVTSFTGVTQEFVDTVYRMAAGSEDMLSAETGRPIDITWDSVSPYPDFDGLGAMSVSF